MCKWVERKGGGTGGRNKKTRKMHCGPWGTVLCSLNPKAFYYEFTHSGSVVSSSSTLESSSLGVCLTNKNSNLYYIAPQQQLHELLSMYRSTSVIEHTSVCYLN